MVSFITNVVYTPVLVEFKLFKDSFIFHCFFDRYQCASRLLGKVVILKSCVGVFLTFVSWEKSLKKLEAEQPAKEKGSDSVLNESKT
jgi:hypothetical protein